METMNSFKKRVREATNQELVAIPTLASRGFNPQQYNEFFIVARRGDIIVVDISGDEGNAHWAPNAYFKTK
jgi:hypothetical protein